MQALQPHQVSGVFVRSDGVKWFWDAFTQKWFWDAFTQKRIRETR